jgi:hypothetical protein
MKINVYDHETGKVIERQMTADEQTNYELIQAEAKNEAEAEVAKATAKEAVLAKLGLTADEVAALLS